jgi:hypothetical protein
MVISSKAIRRAFLAAAVVMVPMGAITLAPVPAGALTFTPFTCSVGGTMTFDAATSGQGISKDGWADAKYDGSQEISYPSLGGAGCSGHGSTSFTYQGVKCDRKTPGLPASNPACEPGLKVGYNSWADVLGNVSPPPYRHGRIGASYADAIQKAFASFRHPWYFVINGTTFNGKATSTSLIPAGSVCGPSEIGFQAAARILEPRHVSQTMTVTICLGAITGTGLNPSDNFYTASIDQIGVVDSAVIDQATSTVHVG